MAMAKLNPREKIGFSLLVFVVASWIICPALALLTFPYKAMIITALVVFGEVMFIISVAILGKEHWESIKSSLIRSLTSRLSRKKNK